MTHIDCDGQTCTVGRGVWILEGFHKLYKMKLYCDYSYLKGGKSNSFVASVLSVKNIIVHKFQEENLESLYATNYALPC